MTKNTIGNIRKSGLFSHWSHEQVECLLSYPSCILKNVESGQFISFKGERYEALYLIIEGAVSAEISDISGKVLKIENLEAPNTVASGILFADDNRLPVNLRAAKECKIICIAREILVEMASQDQKILLELLTDAGNKIALLAEKIRFIQMRTLEQKIAVYFLELQQECEGKFFNLPYNLEELSELFGVTRPALSRSLGLLIDKGILERSSRRYRVSLPEELIKRVDQ